MKPIEELTKYDMDCALIPDGYDMTSIPEPTKRNMKLLVDKIAELTDRVNLLDEKQGIITDDE